MTNKLILISTAYLPPAEYYSNLLLDVGLFIEQHENFPKQTYRNRCVILGANGPIPLVIPVVKGRSGKIKTKDIRIFNEQEWQRNHWRSIFSAYNSSPFFEYYDLELEAFYTKKYDFLLDFNQALLEWTIETLELNITPKLSERFMGKDENILNLSDKISPKKFSRTPTWSRGTTNIEYTQVFSEKFGFVPNLSIIDLLFNEGPNSASILYESISK